jgi:drug/metabolite transporter (DMT)-like permease
MRQLAIAAAACGFGAVSVLAKLAYDAGCAPRSLFASRIVVAGVLLAPLGLGRPLSLSGQRLALVAGGGAAFCGAGLLEFEALARLPASVVVPIVFVAPLWVALLSLLLFRAPPRGRTTCVFPLVLAGLTLLVGIPGGSEPDPGALTLALGASLLFGVVFLILERLVATGSPVRSVAQVMLAAAALAAIVETPGVIGELGSSPNFRYALAAGAITGVSLVLLAVGMVRTGAFRAAVITGAEPLAAALLGWLVLREALSAVQVIGGLVIVVAVAGASVRPHGR